MKQKLLLFLCMFCCITATTFATTFTIIVGATGNNFSPASGIVAHPGDVIKWKWGSGTHTTTSTTIPGTATPWGHSIAAATDSFMYTVSVVGTYNYQCAIHGASMSGSFTVVSATSIAMAGTPDPVFNMFPNPASSYVHLQFNATSPVSVVLTDLAGREVLRNDYNNSSTAELGVENIYPGVYIVRVVQGNAIYRKQLIIAH